MAKKKITVDQSVCLGCGACAGAFPDDLKINDSGLAEPVTGEAEEEAVDVCPVGAIKVED